MQVLALFIVTIINMFYSKNWVIEGTIFLASGAFLLRNECSCCCHALNRGCVLSCVDQPCSERGILVRTLLPLITLFLRRNRFSFPVTWISGTYARNSGTLCSRPMSWIISGQSRISAVVGGGETSRWGVSLQGCFSVLWFGVLMTRSKQAGLEWLL